MKIIFIITLSIIFNSAFASELTFAEFEKEFIQRDPLVEQSQRDPESNSATTKFGALKVKIGSNIYESDIKPWSSWWFPSRDTYIFDRPSTLAPLEIYDQVHRKIYRTNPNSALYEKNELYSNDSANWSGLCHAWAIASIKHSEPTQKLYKEGYYFTPGDQKALLLKTYENVSGYKVHGQRFNGGAFDLYEDMYPDQLHKVIEVFLKDQKKPFIMDYDPSYSVWTVPVYKAKVNITPNNNKSVKVSLWLTYASSFVDGPEFIGTKNVTKVYRYILTGSYSRDVFNVTGGKWTEESIYDHPDYIIEYPEDVKRGTFNKKFDIERVDSILNFN